MSYINFDKNQLVNLEYSLSKELLRSNRAGSFANTTIIGCNTRKYHGLFICPQDGLDGENYVLLSTLHETIIQHDSEFNLGINRYLNGAYNPKGHKYVKDFSTEPIPIITYRVGGVILTKEMLFAQDTQCMIIRYTLVDAHSPTTLRFKPFLAFRKVHSLSKANVYFDNKYEKVPSGVKIRMYAGFTPLYMQFSKQPEYIHVPDWYYNIEYSKEKERGYDYLEDLYVPGYFEIPIQKGESIVFSAGIDKITPSTLTRLFNSEIKKRVPRNSFENCLLNSAEQFLVKRENKTEVVAGFPWFGRWGRDTFISLPGLTLVTDKPKVCKAVLDTMVKELDGPLFPNVGYSYNSVDASLWFFWAVQQYAEYTNTKELIWKEYGKKMKMILDGFKEGTMFNIKMQEDGLLYAGENGKALTWMDAIVAGKPVTPRIGLAVEINALWYNAIRFFVEIANICKFKGMIKEWTEIANKIEISFKDTFWSKEKGYLADYVNGDHKCWRVRPNQVIATSLPYSPLSEMIRKLILDKVEQELLTPRGLRTLSPKHPEYKHTYYGDQASRDTAYHQGTVWPWLLGHFVEGYLKIHGKSGLSFVKNIYDGFDDTLREHGIGTISEVFDGDPPYKPGGAISQAWSVAELLRINYLIKKYSETN